MKYSYLLLLCHFNYLGVRKSKHINVWYLIVVIGENRCVGGSKNSGAKFREII